MNQNENEIENELNYLNGQITSIVALISLTFNVAVRDKKLITETINELDMLSKSVPERGSFFRSGMENVFSEFKKRLLKYPSSPPSGKPE